MKQFFDAQINQLVGYRLAFDVSQGRVRLPVPCPCADLDEDETALLVARLDECMPTHGVISDLRNWDIDLYGLLSDDWYFDVAFGQIGDLEDDENVDALVELFLRKHEEYGMGYDVFDTMEEFRDFVADAAREFILSWRSEIAARFGKA